MSKSERKILEYLGEAHAAELGLTRVLQAQIAVTPAGSFRSLLERHRGETERHAEKLRQRVKEIHGGGAFKPMSAAVGLAETVLSQVLAVAKTPFELLRGSGGEEKMLKNAKDDCAAEALEIATYTALRELADAAGDAVTVKLAAAILVEEEQMLERLLAEIPRLTQAVGDAAFRGSSSYDSSTTGAADTVRAAAGTVKETLRDGVKETKTAARQARKIPGVAQAEGELKGAFADAGDLAIDRYDELTAAEISEQLPALSQIDIAKVDAYERRNHNRTTVLSRITSLRGSEPWPGYDEQTVAEIQKGLAAISDEEKLKSVRRYEQAHKDRSGVLRAGERELAQTSS